VSRSHPVSSLVTAGPYPCLFLTATRIHLCVFVPA